MLFAVGAAVPSSSTTARGWWQQDNEAAVNAVIAQQQDGDEVKADGEIEVGREVRLTMKDGRTFRGEFVKQDRLNVVVKIAGINTTFDRAEVDHIAPLMTFEEQYMKLKATIARDNYAMRYQFCEWLFNRKKYQLAAEELESLLDDSENIPKARALLRTVNKAIEVQESEGGANGQDDEKEAAKQETNPLQSERFVEGSLISDADVNLIRVYEVDLDDPPRLIISRETIDRLADEFKDSESMPQLDRDRKRLYRMKPAEILDLMFRLQAREFYSDVRVVSEPKAFLQFRMNVHRTWLTNSCAASRCHGGPDAGDFFLFNKRTNASRTVYTNFLILERTKVNGKPLIDYERPSDSLLLQMGLPRNQTANPHPAVDGWRPVFRERSDPIYQKAVDWIKAMYRPRPDFPVKFEMPKLGQHRAEGLETEGKGGAGDGSTGG